MKKTSFIELSSESCLTQMVIHDEGKAKTPKLKELFTQVLHLLPSRWLYLIGEMLAKPVVLTRLMQIRDIAIFIQGFVGKIAGACAVEAENVQYFRTPFQSAIVVIAFG